MVCKMRGFDFIRFISRVQLLRIMCWVYMGDMEEKTYQLAQQSDMFGLHRVVQAKLTDYDRRGSKRNRFLALALRIDRMIGIRSMLSSLYLWGMCD